MKPPCAAPGRPLMSGVLLAYFVGLGGGGGGGVDGRCVGIDGLLPPRSPHPGWGSIGRRRGGVDGVSSLIVRILMLLWSLPRVLQHPQVGAGEGAVWHRPLAVDVIGQ